MSKSRKTSSSKRSSSSHPPSKRNKSTIWSILALLLFLLVAYLANEGYIDLDESQLREIAGILLDDHNTPPDQPDAPSPAPVQSMGAMQVFFTTPWLIYPDVPEQRSPPPFEQNLIADIDAAQTSIDVATFEYDLLSIADALVRAQQRGVQVRLALDTEGLEKPDMEAWYERVDEADIPISWQEKDAFLHSKFVIVDDAIVWMGSWNITDNDTYRNNNNLIRFTIPAIVENYVTEFSQMDQGAFSNSKESLAPNPWVQSEGATIENYFSPQDSIDTAIVERLNAAQNSIRFMAFSFTSDPIAEAMIERHNNGVRVQGVFENRNAHGMGAEFERLEDAGIEVFVDGNCYTMHHKVIVIDNATVVTGSYNFSRRAEETNDENLVIIDAPDLASQYQAEFERVYEQALNPTQCGR